VTATVVVVLATVLCAPALVFPWYAPLFGTACVLVAVGGSIRTVLVVGVALSPNPDPPPLPVNPPTVSILVTAYNDAVGLRETLDACSHLAYPADCVTIYVGYEAVSTDETATVAQRAARTDARVHAVERPGPPGGKAAAVNSLLPHVDSDIVVSLDAGQRLEPGSLARAVRWLVSDPETWCVKGRSYGRNADESLLSLCATVERHLAERLAFVSRSRLGWFSLFTGGQAFFRASTLESLGRFDETVLLEDVEMATRIHRRGGAVRVDPAVVASERTPSTLAAWIAQRRRWARGGMQVARRSLGGLLRSRSASVPTRLDAAYTFALLLSVPIVVLLAPVVAPTAATVLGVVPWWFSLSPFVVLYALFLRDFFDGHRHAPREYAAPLLLPAYFALQSLVVLVAFVDEFVLRRPSEYVTSRRGGEDSA
jgi:cellulose synthase/poly-beta-1,6-N-acetylglucosamine synthase-like glycosyltransferase